MDENTFIVELGSVPPKDSLKYHLSSEFEYFGVWAYCNVFVYNNEKQDTLYSFNLDAATTGPADKSAMQIVFPQNRANNYMMLYFPHRSKYIIQEMSFWIGTAVLLIILLVGLSFALFVFVQAKIFKRIAKRLCK